MRWRPRALYFYFHRFRLASGTPSMTGNKLRDDLVPGLTEEFGEG